MAVLLKILTTHPLILKISVLALQMLCKMEWMISVSVPDTDSIYKIIKKNVDSNSSHFQKIKIFKSLILILKETGTEQVQKTLPELLLVQNKMTKKRNYNNSSSVSSRKDIPGHFAQCWSVLAVDIEIDSEKSGQPMNVDKSIDVRSGSFPTRYQVGCYQYSYQTINLSPDVYGVVADCVGCIEK